MIDAEGHISEVIQCDVTNEESCKAAVAKAVELFGAVHILVNVVGVGGPHGSVVDVDLEGTYFSFPHLEALNNLRPKLGIETFERMYVHSILLDLHALHNQMAHCRSQAWF